MVIRSSGKMRECSRCPRVMREPPRATYRFTPRVRKFFVTSWIGWSGSTSLEAMSAFESFPRVTPFLWFDSNAEEAVEFYVSIFKNSRRLNETRPDPKGRPLTIGFELEGEKF